MTARQADHPIDALFLNRHSPRAFTTEEIPQAELLTLMEAARWAPSASNTQPARLAWGRRGEAEFQTIAGLLVPGNRIWAERAAALVVVASQAEKEGAALTWHAFDAGAAWMSLALQAHLRGWVAHAMGGFDKEAAVQALHLPAGHALHCVVAIGRQGPAETLPEHQRPREMPNSRRPLSEVAGHGRFL
ncbi:nitroreductase family protein [Stagnihabitans tardus]|uniref:Nitroreductase domain-containing protein n=1 Tax=Stagnihabitans tardus TaxID=2699202 RepID=A0AAE4Y8P8_9RHOB|nr:nitroreductase family protein [Stagnihabitans tardus]NBZ88003.1 hypothetical protein [Stagnihabitans tardus]